MSTSPSIRPASTASSSRASSNTDYAYIYGCTPVFTLTGGWKRYVHINGGVYYYHAQRRIITERDVTEPRDQEAVLEGWKEFMEISQENGMVRYVTADADVVLRYLPRVSDTEEEDEEALELAEAFFVCYSNASEVKCPCFDRDDISVQHDTYTYWTHIEEYPMHLREKTLFVAANATACFWSSIAFLSDARTFEVDDFILPFTSEQIERIIEVYEDLSDTCETNQAMIPVLIWYLSRIIREVKSTQEGTAMAVGCHTGTEVQGQYGYAIKRLSSASHKAIRGGAEDSNKNDWSIVVAESLFSILLLFTNRSYQKRLAQTRVAWSVYLEDFRQLVEKMLTEWTDTNLLATVFVGANVSFLSIPSITTMQRTASLSSAMFSIVSIGSGLYQVWHHRTKVRAEQVEATKYVYHVQGPHGKGESDMIDPLVMSFFLAIPVAALLWAVLCFAIALVAFCVQVNDSNGRIILSVVIGVGVLISVLAAASLRRVWPDNAASICSPA